MGNHYGVFGTQKYGVPLFPIVELSTQRDYDGKIISAAVYVPVNREEVQPYKAMLNSFSFEVIGTRLDMMKLCAKQLPDFKLSKQVSEAVSVLRRASKTSTQSVNIICHYTTNNLVNPSVLLEFKIKGLRTN